MVEEIKQKIAKSEFVKTEVKNLNSLRVKLVYMTFVMWAYIISKTPSTDLKDILYQVTFVLSILVLLYVLGKKNIKFEIGPIKLDVAEVQKPEEKRNVGDNSTVIDPK